MINIKIGRWSQTRTRRDREIRHGAFPFHKHIRTQLSDRDGDRLRSCHGKSNSLSSVPTTETLDSWPKIINPRNVLWIECLLVGYSRQCGIRLRLADKRASVPPSKVSIFEWRGRRATTAAAGCVAIQCHQYHVLLQQRDGPWSREQVTQQLRLFRTADRLP